eukprot:6210605-Pleurochrysis_carterae.AAC.1
MDRLDKAQLLILSKNKILTSGLMHSKSRNRKKGPDVLSTKFETVSDTLLLDIRCFKDGWDPGSSRQCIGQILELLSCTL